jgi:thiamine biosynthesis lipoprotein
MGTSYTVELAAPIDDAVRTRLAELIEVELAAINRAMSTYDPRSELSEFNRRQDLRWAPASRGLLEVLDRASQISTASQGAFDVTVGPLVDPVGPGVRVTPTSEPARGYQHVSTIRWRSGRGGIQSACVYCRVRCRS